VAGDSEAYDVLEWAKAKIFENLPFFGREEKILEHIWKLIEEKKRSF